MTLDPNPAFVLVVILAFAIALLLGRRSKRAAVIYLTTIGVFLGIVSLTFLDAADPSEVRALSPQIWYFGWPDQTVLSRMASRKPAGPLTVVCSEAALARVRSVFLNAEVRALDPVPAQSEDGLTAEAGLRDLGKALPGLPADAVVSFICTRSADATEARRLGTELVRKMPSLRGRIKSIAPEEFGLRWPTLTLEQPLIVSPYQTEMPVKLIGRNLPSGSTLSVRMMGPKQGTAFQHDTQLTVAELGRGTSDDTLAISGAPFHLTHGSLTARAALPTPTENHSLTIDATMTSDLGEVVAWTRGTTTARIQPFGVLVSKARKDEPSALKVLLDDLDLPWELVAVDLSSAADVDTSARQLARWRVLLMDSPLDGTESFVLQQALRRAGSTPILLFVGSGSDTGKLPAGWAQLMKLPVEPGKTRVIVVCSDTSASMNYFCGGSSGMKKFEFSGKLAEAIAPDYSKRQWNGGVRMLVGPDGQESFRDGTNTVAVDVNNYAVPGKHSPWELSHMLLAVFERVKKGEQISHAILVFDPDDVESSSVLPGSARDAARGLLNAGVRLWLIAAGRHPNVQDLGPEIAAMEAKGQGVILSLGQFSGSADALIAACRKRITEELFPYLKVTTEPAGMGQWLTVDGRERLADFFTRNAANVRLLNGLVPFALKADYHAEDTVLWLEHWSNTGRPEDAAKDHFSPLLVKGDLNLGGGPLGRYMHLALDLTAERAAIPSGTGPHRRALAGLFVRVVSGLSDERQEPGIFWAARDDAGLSFYTARRRPFDIEPQSAPDSQSLRGFGLLARRIDGYDPGTIDSQPDGRQLDLPTLTIGRLHRSQPSVVRFVIEDRRPEIGRLALDLTLTAPPAQPLIGGADALGLGDSAGATTAPPASPTLRLPAWAVPWAFGAAWFLLAVVLLRKL
jgi:hypothetical protein